MIHHVETLTAADLACFALLWSSLCGHCVLCGGRPETGSAWQWIVRRGKNGRCAAGLAGGDRGDFAGQGIYNLLCGRLNALIFNVCYFNYQGFANGLHGVGVVFDGGGGGLENERAGILPIHRADQNLLALLQALNSPRRFPGYAFQHPQKKEGAGGASGERTHRNASRYV